MFNGKSNANGREEERATDASTIDHRDQTIQTLHAVIRRLDQQVDAAESKGKEQKLENDELKREMGKLHQQPEVSNGGFACALSTISCALS